MSQNHYGDIFSWLILRGHLKSYLVNILVFSIAPLACQSWGEQDLKVPLPSAPLYKGGWGGSRFRGLKSDYLYFCENLLQLSFPNFEQDSVLRQKVYCWQNYSDYYPVVLFASRQ